MLPEVIHWAKFEKGDVVAEPIAEVVSEELGVPITILTPPTSKERNHSLATGESNLCFISNTNYYDSMRGVYYNGKAHDVWESSFGPPRFRLIFAGFTVIGSAIVRADTDIYQISDLKGKTVAVANQYPSVAINALAGLAFGNLTLDDITVVNAGTFTTGIEMLLEGKVDAAYGSATGLAEKFAKRPPGLRWLPLPHEDTEGWNRFWKIRPFLQKEVYDKGLMEGNPVQMFKAEYMLVSMDFQSEEFVYAVTRAIHHGYPAFKDRIKPMGTEQVTIERTLNIDLYRAVSIPYHDGVIRLARELGMWTKQHEQYQANALKDQAHWVSVWQDKYGKQ